MNASDIASLFTAMPPMVLAIWTGLGLAALIVIGMAIRAERRSFVARGQGGAWLMLRLASLPIALFTAAMVWLPARAVGGPEALAVFYGLLLVAAPLAYFGLHALAGRLLRIAARDSAVVAFSGLAMVLGPALGASVLNPWVHTIARQSGEQRFAAAAGRPWPYTIAAQRRFTLPEVGEVWTEHWQAPAGLAVERVELEMSSGGFLRMDDGNSGLLCRDGQDVHVLWQAADPPPHWRLYWQAPEGLARSQWRSVPPPGPAESFEVKWLHDGMELPVRVPRERVSLGRTRPDGREDFDLLSMQPGAGIANNCLPLTYRRAGTAGQLLTAFRMMFWSRAAQEAKFATWRREAAEAAEPNAAAPAGGGAP